MVRARPARPPLVALLLALLQTACGPADRAPGSDGGPMGLDAPDAPLELAASPVYRLGGFDAEGWEQFGRVTNVAFDGAGNLHILDAQAMQVTVVDPSGTRLRTLGRPGGGPGEFGAPLGMAVFPDGRVVVSDIGNRGLVVFRGDGSFDRVVPFEGTAIAGGILALPPDRVLQAGGGIRMSIRGPGSAGPPATPTTRPVQAWSLDGGPPETLHEAWLMPPPDAPDGPSTTLAGPSGQRITLSSVSPLRAFEPGLHVQPLPDGRLAVADSVGYRIRILRDGAVDAVIERPIPPVAVTPGIQEAERRRRIASLESGGTQSRVVVMGGSGGGAAPIDVSEMERQRIEGMVFAPEIPVIARVGVDPAGRLWVERSGAEPGEDGPTDLVTPDGRYLGTIAPDGMRIPSAFGPDGLVAYLERDEYDAAVVVVLRLTGGWPGE